MLDCSAWPDLLEDETTLQEMWTSGSSICWDDRTPNGERNRIAEMLGEQVIGGEVDRLRGTLCLWTNKNGTQVRICRVGDITPNVVMRDVWGRADLSMMEAVDQITGWSKVLGLPKYPQDCIRYRRALWQQCSPIDVGLIDNLVEDQGWYGDVTPDTNGQVWGILVLRKKDCGRKGFEVVIHEKGKWNHTICLANSADVRTGRLIAGEFMKLLGVEHLAPFPDQKELPGKNWDAVEWVPPTIDPVVRGVSW